MTAVEKLITDHLDLWTAAIKRRSTVGRGSSSKIELYGIKKLRELILELAVRGLLVPQDPKDEPASELLKKIAAEKTGLVKKGKSKNEKAFPPIAGDGQQKLPFGWSWTCMAALGEISPRNEVEDCIIASFVPMPFISTRFDGKHDHESKTWSEIKKGYTHFADGDVAIAKITPCFENSKAAIFSGLHNGVGAGTTELHVVRPYGEFVSRGYLLLYLKSPQFLRVGESRMTGSAGQKRVPTEFFSFNPLPLPPLAEQHRIVAKADELMALCDQLERQTDTSLSAHKTLVETLLNALTGAADQTQFDSSWQRIAEHFDTLFTTEESIDQLKQTILQLGVMGKLVQQDPNDEPASELLKQMAEEKAQLIKEKKIRNSRPLVAIADDEKFMQLPAGWTFARLNDVGDWGAGATPSRNSPELYGGHIPWFKSGELVADYIYQSEETVTELALKRASLRYNNVGDVLIAMYGATIGKTAILSVPATTNQAVCACTPFSGLESTYLLLLLKAYRPRFIGMGAGGAQPNISREKIIETVVAVPPNTEQRRIVAKVDEMMALCDQLKSSLSDAQVTQLHLADALTDKTLARA